MSESDLPQFNACKSECDSASLMLLVCDWVANLHVTVQSKGKVYLKDFSLGIPRLVKSNCNLSDIPPLCQNMTQGSFMKANNHRIVTDVQQV